VIASRPARGWLLLGDAGARARERPIDWAPLQRRYAQLQLAASSEVDRMLAAGVPDRRSVATEIAALLPVLEPATAAALESRLEEIEATGAELHGIAATVDHGDLHDGNVFASPGHVRILDWGDACVAHPFLSLGVEMDPGARSAYLEPFTAVAARAEIDRAVAAVLRLRTLIRAVNYQRVVPYDAEWSRFVEDRVAAFLAGE
jgi:hypothetical protein